MTSYNPAVKNASGGWIGYVSLAPYTPTGQFQSNPTLAAGDVKVSIDGGARANLTNLPVVTPASSKSIKIILTQAEINGDNITIVFSDQTSPPEWTDLIFTLQTVARNFDDLAYPATSGRSMIVDASGNVNGNLVNIAGSAVSASTAQLGVNIVNVKGSASTGAAGYVGIDWNHINAPTTTVNLTNTSTKALQPTTAGRTLDVTATGAAGIDWGNVENQSTAVDLSSTTIQNASDVPTADQNADALLDRADAIETGLTPRQAWRLTSSTTEA